jgi:hypothetical protein
MPPQEILRGGGQKALSSSAPRTQIVKPGDVIRSQDFNDLLTRLTRIEDGLWKQVQAPKPVTVPDLTKMTLGDAREAIKDASLRIGRIVNVDSLFELGSAFGSAGNASSNLLSALGANPIFVKPSEINEYLDYEVLHHLPGEDWLVARGCKVMLFISSRFSDL